MQSMVVLEPRLILLYIIELIMLSILYRDRRELVLGTLESPEPTPSASRAAPGATSQDALGLW